MKKIDAKLIKLFLFSRHQNKMGNKHSVLNQNFDNSIPAISPQEAQNFDNSMPAISPQEAQKRKKRLEEISRVLEAQKRKKRQEENSRVLERHLEKLELDKNYCGFGWAGRTGDFPRHEDLSIYKDSSDDEIEPELKQPTWREKRNCRLRMKRIFKSCSYKIDDLPKFLKAAGFSQEIVDGEPAWILYVNSVFSTKKPLVFFKGVSNPSEQEICNEIGKAAWDKMKCGNFDVHFLVLNFVESKERLLQIQTEAESSSALASTHLFDDN
jgi:hypothetical protein